MPKPTISKNGVWAVKKGAELNLSLNEMIDPHHQRLNLRTDLSEQVTKVLLMLDETIKKENNQQAIIVLNDLQETLKQIKIVYLFPPSSDDLNYFSVRSFLYLEQICLNQVPPSTVLHLYELRTHLKKLMIVHSGITNLFAVLTPVSKKWKKYLKPMITNDDLNQISNNVPPPIHGNNAPTTTPVPSIQRLPQESCWTKLLFLTLSNCGLVKIDESLHFFPNLIELDLSHNSIAYIVHLQDCIALESINLSYNRIRILSNLERTVGSVKNINLSHNEIESLDGIDKIYSLERINFANNCINDIMEAQYLSRLPCLLAMVFHNNPIVELKHYRLRVYREFIKVGSLMSGNRPFPELDKQAITKKELKKLRKLIFMSPTDAMVESSYAPVYMNGFDFSFDEFDEAEFEDYPDEEAVYPNDYRRSVVGRQSPIPGTASPTQNANGGMNPRSSLSPTRNRSVSPFGRTNSVGNAGISTSRRTLSKRYSSDYMASSMMDARDLADFDLLRRRSSAYSRSSVIRFMRAPSTRKRRAANIYDDEVQDTFLPLSEVRRDLKENPDAWLVHEKQPEPIASTSPVATDAAKKKEAGVDATSPMSEDSKVFFPIPAPTAEGPTHPRATSPLLSHAEVKSKASFESSSTLVNEMKGAEEKLAGVHISEANSEKSTPSQSFSVAQGVEKPFPPVSYVASLDRNSNVSIYHQRPSELTAANLTAANASTNFVPSMESPNGPASSQNKSQDSIMLKIDPYVGDNQYRNLSVMDNLELYFREQVFPASRPCFPDLYLRDKAYSSLSTSTDGKSSLNSPKNTANSGKQKVQDYSLRFVSSFSPEERFITLFCEKVIDLKDGMNQSSIVTVDANDDDEAIPRRSSKASKNERGILGGSGRESITAPSAGVAGESSERMPREIDAVIILTDVGFYMIDYNEINPKTTFAESPLFTVLCALPLYKLSTCTIYFGFQRCALGFYDNPYQLLENYQKGLPVSTNISDMLAAYMIVTRDKSHTYPISTRIPQVANIQRNGMKPQPLNNVKIDNKDGQLLEQLMKVTGDPDVSYYQLLYQTWRKKPGVRLPRSIIVTKSTILLCAEDLCSIDVKLTILDQYSLKDILKIYHEDSNTLHIVIKFKRMNVLSVQKKWRLYTDSRNISTRIMEELKRSCEEVGNGDV